MPLDITTASPTAPQITRGPLATTTLTTMKAYFDTTGHNPSADHWGALGDIADTLEQMANGTCERRVFLSSIDPGVGKSQTTLHFARALMDSPDYRHAGMVVCVGRLDEARTMATALAPYRDRLAVLTSDDTLNALGDLSDNAGAAQVLITTQQRIERATEGNSFEGVSAFHYQGEARQVRVWDEAWLPGGAVSVDSDELGALFTPAAALSRGFRNALRTLSNDLVDAKTGDVVAVPDWTQSFGVTLSDLLNMIGDGDKNVRDDHRMVATAVFVLGGHTAGVWKDNQSGAAVLSYRDLLPRDLAPLLVLDASGRVRQTYKDMVDHRGLVKLREATKDYGPLTIHHWKTSGSKSGFHTKGPELVQGIADTILAKPDEKWLVVAHRKDSKVGDVARELYRSLPAGVRPNVSVITWGNHMATNDFADVGNLILAGTLFMRPRHYAALTHLAQDRPTGHGLATPEEVRKTTCGEHANFILQAICRGRVRRSDGSRCLPMDAYIIAAAKSGIGEALPDIFPGATIKVWSPIRPVVTGKLKEAIGIIQAMVTSGETWIGLGTLRASLGMSGGDFRSKITDAAAWKDTLADLALVPHTGPRNAPGLRVGKRDDRHAE